jgi:hypothetical protein
MQQRRQGAYLVMELTGWVVLVPLSLASLATGLVCSLGSAWACSDTTGSCASS